MPAFIPKTAGPQAAASATGTPELVARNCRLEEYEKVRVRKVAVTGECIAFASPDSTFAVHKKLLEGARTSILIGIYDFTAGYVKDLLLNALARGVTVELMLDTDERKGEPEIFDELASMGVRCVSAPSCAGDGPHVFASSHEKVIVIDDAWVIVQSGNYTESSIPLNTVDGGEPENYVPGNRDMGLAFQSKLLARFFRKILEADIALKLSGPEAAAVIEALPEGFFIEAAPKIVPEKLFPSQRFALSGVDVLPVLSPDNYMEVVPELLRQAKRSVVIEQQYIRASQEEITTLLDALAEARDAHPNIECRIILGKVFDAKALEKERANLKRLAQDYGLRLGTNIRFIDENRFVHCHNKLLVVDGTRVLVGSQNWSSSAVAKNREASVLLTHKGIASYFSRIFEFDWTVARKRLPSKRRAVPETLAAGGFVRVRPSDYMEV